MPRRKRKTLPTPTAGWAVYLRTSSDENQKPETINAISAEVISMWHIVCKQGVSVDTRTEFFGHVMKYFGFSEQNLINMVKKLSRSDKQD